MTQTDLPAGLQTDGREFQLGSAPSGKEVTIGRRGRRHQSAPDIDLADLPNGRTVSRRHARLRRRDDEWFLRVEQDTQNPTEVDGQLIAPGEEIGLRDGQHIQLGGVALQFHEPNPIQLVDDDTIGLSLDSDTIEVAPGSGRVVVATIVNFTNSVDGFRIELFGLPADWYQLQLPQAASDGASVSRGIGLERVDLRLFQTQAHGAPASDAVGRVHIQFAPPRTPAALAGEHVFVVRVTSRATRLRREIKAKLILDPFEGLALTAVPQVHATAASGDFEWLVRNTGNAEAEIKMTARPGAVREGPLAAQLALMPIEEESAQSDAATKDLAFGWNEEQFRLRAGASRHTRLNVRVRKRPLWGEAKSYTFFAAAAADTLVVKDRGYIVCPPRIPSRMQAMIRWIVGKWPLLLILLGLLLLILPAQVEITVSDRLITDGHDVPASDRTTEVAAGDEVWLELGSLRAASATVDAAVYDTLPPAQPCHRELAFVKVDGSVCEYWFGSTRWLRQFPLQDVRYVIHGNNFIGLQSGAVDWPLIVHPSPTIDDFESSTASVAREGDPVKLKWKVRAAPNDDMHIYVRKLASQGSVEQAGDPCDRSNRDIQKNRLLIEAAWLDPTSGTVQAIVRNVCHWALQPMPSQLIVGDLSPLPIRAQDGQLALDQPIKPGEHFALCTCASGGSSDREAVAAAFSRPGTPLHILNTDGHVVADGQVEEQIYPAPNTIGALDSELTVQPADASTDYVLEAWSRWTRLTPTVAKRTITVGAPGIDALTATPQQTTSGGQVRLQYTVKGATRLALFGSTTAEQDGDELVNSDTSGLLTADGWAVSVPAVTQATDYWLTLVADNAATRDPAAPRVVKKVKVAVVPSQVFFRAEPETIAAGDAVSLVWQADQAPSVRVDPGVGDVPVGPGRAQLKPTVDTDYVLSVTGMDGVVTKKTVTVHVQAPPEPTPSPTPEPSQEQASVASGSGSNAPPKVDFFQAAPVGVERGQPVRLVFSVHGAQHVVIQDADGAILAQQDGDGSAMLKSFEVVPTASTIYALTATGLGGEVTQPVSIEVRQ